jgi:hypothetical protein
MNVLETIRGLWRMWWPQPAPPPLPLPPPLPEPVAAPVATPKKFTPEQRAAAQARRTLRAQRDAVADMADDILTRLQQLPRRRQLEGRASQERTLSQLLGCDFHLVNSVDDDAPAEPGEMVLNEDAAELAHAIWPIDIGVVVRHEGYFYFRRVVTAQPREMRGLARAFTKQMLMMSGGEVRDDGTWWAENVPIGLVNGAWRDLSAGMQIDFRETRGGSLIGTRVTSQLLRQQLANVGRLTNSLALTERYLWHVALGFPDWPDGPRILMPTSPAGCLSFYKDRELDPTCSRRAALRHWVREHYRDIGDAGLGLAFVREHLRGCTEFIWHGLAAELLVSAYDLERNELFKQQAEGWRAARKHNAVRVKLKKHQGVA